MHVQSIAYWGTRNTPLLASKLFLPAWLRHLDGRLASSWRCLGPLQLGEFLDQLLDSEFRKLHGDLRRIAVAFAAEDHAFAVLRMADTLAVGESRCPDRGCDFHFRTRAGRSSPGGKEPRNVVERARIRFAGPNGLRSADAGRGPLVLILIAVVPTALEAVIGRLAIARAAPVGTPGETSAVGAPIRAG